MLHGLGDIWDHSGYNAQAARGDRLTSTPRPNHARHARTHSSHCCAVTNLFASRGWQTSARFLSPVCGRQPQTPWALLALETSGPARAARRARPPRYTVQRCLARHHEGALGGASARLHRQNVCMGCVVAPSLGAVFMHESGNPHHVHCRAHRGSALGRVRAPTPT